MNKSKIKKIIFASLILILLIITLCLLLNKQRNISKINEEKINIGNIDIAGVTIDITKVLSTTPNAPQLGAGMIPIKFENGYWQITNENDNNWYDYNNGKLATIMLSDGKYISEERYNMQGHEIAKNGTQIKNTEDFGTIYTWIPRGLYIENEYKYLKETSILDIGNYKTPSCFTYTITEDTELALSGIWVAMSPNQNDMEQTLSQMDIEDNEYGLIKNEKIEQVSDDIIKIVSTLQQNKDVNNQQVSDLENKNRISIKILDTSILTPIIGQTFLSQNNESSVKVLYSKYNIDKIICIDTKDIQNGGTTMTIQVTLEGVYRFVIMDTEGNIREYMKVIGPNEPDLTGFRVDKTYIVTYSSNGEENSSVLMKDVLKDGSQISDSNTLISGGVDHRKILSKTGQEWYEYLKQKWANIVVRNGISEAYFVWIPRYVYRLDNTAQTSEAKFVTIDNIDNDGNEIDLTEWSLSEAFKWTDLEGNEVQLAGYWMSKYGLSDSVELNLQANIRGGKNKIKVDNITSSVSTEKYKYNVYIFKEGVNKTRADEQDEIAEYRVGYKENVTYSYLLENLEAGKYEVRISVENVVGVSVGEKWYSVTVNESATDIVQPDLTGFNPNNTYYVSYNDDGDEVLTPITHTAPSNWYDYDFQEWANIVVINPDISAEEKRAYFVWIPRYVYKLDQTTQTSEVKFVTTENKDSDGNEVDLTEWSLSEAFKWTDLEGNEVQLAGYWMSKYGLSD